jgi:hypothetical protein
MMSIGGWRSQTRNIEEHGIMGFDQYHEAPDELPDEPRMFAWLIASLTDDAEAIGWTEQVGVGSSTLAIRHAIDPPSGGATCRLPYNKA